MYTRRSIMLASILSLLATGCAHYPKTTQLQKYDLRAGYRFEELAYDGKPKGQTTMNSDDLFVVLAFSGGGTRAGAFSYGVLQQLKHITFTIPGGQQRRLLDEVDVISSVSGGSFTAAYYALRHDGIFNEDGPFHRRFLYYPTQRDLLAQAVYYRATGSGCDRGRRSPRTCTGRRSFRKRPLRISLASSGPTS